MAFNSDRLIEARKAMSENGRPVSQERFAELCGVSRRATGRWETGGIEPRLAQLSRIAEVTCRPIGFFFDEAPEVVDQNAPFRDAA